MKTSKYVMILAIATMTNLGFLQAANTSTEGIKKQKVDSSKSVKKSKKVNKRYISKKNKQTDGIHVVKNHIGRPMLSDDLAPADNIRYEIQREDSFERHESGRYPDM